MTTVAWLAFQLENKHCTFTGMRFVDDIRIAIFYPLDLGHEWASARARQILACLSESPKCVCGYEVVAKNTPLQ